MQTHALEDKSWCWRDAQTRQTWLFGMRWFPSLGNKGRRQLYRNLRQQGFMWAVTHGKSLSLVGVPSGHEATKPTRQTLSAAAAFACAHPQGVHALCLEVTGVGVWFVASSDGCVLSETDRWYASLAQAQLALQPLRERHDPLRYVHVVWTPVAQATSADTSSRHNTDPSSPETSPPPEPVANAAATPEFLRGRARKDCQFHKLPAAQSSWPLWLAFGCLGAAAVLVVHRLWWAPARPQAQRPLVIALPDKPITVKVHDPDRLRDVFMAWQQLPVDPAGWLLKGVRCAVVGTHVQCVANYQRQRPDADNAGLAGHAPASWRFTPDTLEQAQLQRSLTLPLLAQPASSLMTTDQGLTRLQRASGELASASVGKPRPVAGSSVRLGQQQGVQQGVPAVSPSGVARGTTTSLVRRAVSVRLALRQRKRLMALQLPVRWQQMDLLVVPGAQIDQRQGYLMVAMQGDWLAPAQSPQRLAGQATDNATADAGFKAGVNSGDQVHDRGHSPDAGQDMFTRDFEGDHHEIQ